MKCRIDSVFLVMVDAAAGLTNRAFHNELNHRNLPRTAMRVPEVGDAYARELLVCPAVGQPARIVLNERVSGWCLLPCRSWGGGSYCGRVAQLSIASVRRSRRRLLI